MIRSQIRIVRGWNRRPYRAASNVLLRHSDGVQGDRFRRWVSNWELELGLGQPFDVAGSYGADFKRVSAWHIVPLKNTGHYAASYATSNVASLAFYKRKSFDD